MANKIAELPWEVIRTSEGRTALKSAETESTGAEFVAEFFGANREANAAYVAHACNTHQDLVAALKAQIAFEDHREYCVNCTIDECVTGNFLEIEAEKLRRLALAKAEVASNESA